MRWVPSGRSARAIRTCGVEVEPRQLLGWRGLDPGRGEWPGRQGGLGEVDELDGRGIYLAREPGCAALADGAAFGLYALRGDVREGFGGHFGELASATFAGGAS